MKILIIGSGGHAKVVIEACELQGKYEIVGLLDDVEPIGGFRHGYPILSTTNDTELMMKTTGAEGVFFAIGDNFDREFIENESFKLSAPCVSIIHPSAIISAKAKIWDGVYVGAGAIVNPGAEIGDGCIINTNATVEHDVAICCYSSLAPNAVMAGRSSLGRLSHVGIGACVKHKVSIGSNTVIGMGSVVVSNIPDEVVAYGNPCRVIRNREFGQAYL